ncbi:MAG TPA: amidohydrolase family protein [Vicinamibacteria bacterium]|nr:amidohydrolase family protein [Vicinamibacteria bacterium]
MKTRLLAIVLALLWAVPGGAQSRASDRRRSLAPGMLTSDDPRRVPVAPGPQGPDGAIVLRGGRIFDGTGAPAREGTIVIERNRITRVLPPASTDWPAAARVIHVSGRTVMPGLIDLHTHLDYAYPDSPELTDAAAALRGAEKLRYYIESGITSVRDVGSGSDVPFQLKQWVQTRRLVGPRVFAAGRLIVGTGGHGTEGSPRSGPAYGALHNPEMREASGPDDWREAVREQFAAGADVIKIASHFSKPEAAAAIEEAHALGLKVSCDCENFYVQWAVEAGVDVIEHPLPRTDETIALMAQKGVAADPTLVPYIYIFDISGGYFGSTSRRFGFSKEANLEMLRRLKRAGLKIGVGTDLVETWYRFLPAPYLTELRQFVAAGFSAAEALVAATKTNSEILDMDDKLGTLVAGKLADVLVVDGRPDQEIGDVVKVQLVIRDGEVVVESGRVFIPRHVPVPEPTPKPLG